MSTPFHVLLNAVPSLKGDVAGGEADPSACLKLGQVFLRTDGSKDHQLFFTQAGLS